MTGRGYGAGTNAVTPMGGRSAGASTEEEALPGAAEDFIRVKAPNER